MRAPPSLPHLNLIISQRTHLQIPLHQGLGLQHMNFGGTQSVYSNHLCKNKQIKNRLMYVQITCLLLTTIYCLLIAYKAFVPIRKGAPFQGQST